MQLGLICSNSRLFNLGFDDPSCFYLSNLNVGCTQQTQHHLLHPQVSSANLERSYRRAPKGSRGDGNDGDWGVEGAGICHLCMCGQGVDWENLFLDCAKEPCNFVNYIVVFVFWLYGGFR